MRLRVRRRGHRRAPAGQGEGAAPPASRPPPLALRLCASRRRRPSAPDVHPLLSPHSRRQGLLPTLTHSVDDVVFALDESLRLPATSIAVRPWAALFPSSPLMRAESPLGRSRAALDTRANRILPPTIAEF